MPDAHTKRSVLVDLHPVGTIFAIWFVLDQIAFRGAPLAPTVIGTAVFQRVAALVLGVVLAIGWLVAFRRALRGTGRARFLNAGLALVFASICAYRVVNRVRLGNEAWDLAVTSLTTVDMTDAALAKVVEGAWTDDEPKTRASYARNIYRIRGYRIVYRDENGAPRLYEPPPDLVAKDREHRRAEASARSFVAFTSARAPHTFRVAYAYLFGIGVMLVGSLAIAVGQRDS